MSNSKRLLINGSPNKNGQSMNRAKALFDLTDTTLYHAYDLTVHSCDDCKGCHYKSHCKFQDDMDDLFNALKQADTLIIVSPIYFGGMSDQVMRIINRFQMLYERKYTHHLPMTSLKALYTVTTCGAKNDTMFDGAKKTHAILTSLFDATHSNVFHFNGTDHSCDNTALIEHYKPFIY